MAKVIKIHRTQASDASKVLKFFHKVHGTNFEGMPPIIDRFALPWISDVVCRGICFSASMEGRLIGTLGLAKDPYLWNKYEFRLRSQWFYVLNDYSKTDVRDRLIQAAKFTAESMSYPIEIDIPEYLRKDTDVESPSLSSSYLYGA